MNRIEAAQAFAHAAHDSVGQKRKYTGEPYWVHTDEVAQIVASVGGTEDMIVAAHLHDVLEDVTPINPEYSFQRILKEFGQNAASMVVDLTDEFIKEKYPKMNRAKRKQRERERIEKTQFDSQTIKLADLLSNTRSIVAHDPDFARVYLREKLALLGCLTNGSPILLQQATDLTLENFAKLGMTIPMVSS